MTQHRRERIAGIVLLFGFVYIVFEFLSAMAWVDPPYDWAKNFISDLGFSDCAVVDGDRICSPLHPLMNAGFLVQGTVFTIGGMLVARVTLESSRQRLVISALLVASGVGTFFVGVFHQSVDFLAAGLNPLHLGAATLAIAAGNVGILALGILVVRSSEWRAYGIAIIVLGALGLLAGGLLIAEIDFGLGLGLVERAAVYPLNAWTIGSGVGFTVKSIRDRRRAELARLERLEPRSP